MDTNINWKVQGLLQALMFTTIFAQKIEFYGYCLFCLVTLKVPPGKPIQILQFETC